MIVDEKSKMTTLAGVDHRVNDLSRNCWDDNVQKKDICFNDLNSVRIAGQNHALRPVAQRAISARLGVPYQYLKKCPSYLQAENLNHWIEEEQNDEFFVRFDGSEIRAVFTTRYTPVDNTVVLNKIFEHGYDPNLEVQCYLDDEYFTVNIPDSEKTFAVNGDRITPGISISNSEVGLSSLHITAFYMRLVCTNGLIAKTGVNSSYRHISERVLNEFDSVMDNVGSNLLRESNRFRLSISSRVVDPKATLESFNRQFQLNGNEISAVDWAWPQEAGDTMFNIIQTYTRAADYITLNAESSNKLQKTGGEILALLN